MDRRRVSGFARRLELGAERPELMGAHEARRSLELMAGHHDLPCVVTFDGGADLGDPRLSRRDEILDHLMRHIGVVAHDPEQNLRIYPRFHAAMGRKAGAAPPGARAKL